MSETIKVLLGTTKGVFILTGDEERQDWSVSGPHCDGWPINHVVGDPATGTIWAGGGGEFHGAGVWRSADGGGSWTLTRLSAGDVDDWAASDPEVTAFFDWLAGDPPPFGKAFNQVWSLNANHGRLHVGTKPANLLVSADGGVSFTKVEGLTNHPSRPDWNGGAAGLTLHSIVPDPGDAGKMWVGISAAGVFATEDGGQSWDRRNRLSNAEACGDHHHPAGPRDGETGHCVHNMGRGSDGTLYQQNHHGVWRSRDGGRSWDDINAGLPSTFGFPIAVNPHDPAMIWTLPLNGDAAGRYPPDASAAVWKSADGGDSWQKKQSGLPVRDCYFTVLRQAMATDRASPAGVYFGTNSGSVFASADAGEGWSEIARHLPTILSVEVLQR